jgi:hypothetical protein
MATQRVDGFLSADTGYRGGTLITKPILIGRDPEPQSILLNIDTSASGEAKIALLDEQNKTIPGFGLDACPRIQTNHTAFEVSFSGGKNIAALKGKKVKVLVESRATRLFSIRFGAAESDAEQS